MTPESERWTELARRLAEYYADSLNARGVVLGGSVARGHADRNSDVDFFVFVQDFPDVGIRERAVKHIAGERWRSHDGKRRQGMVRDCFWSGDARVAVELVLVDAFETVIHQVLDNLDIDRSKQALLGGLLDAFRLHDDGLVAKWQTRISAYPGPLSRRVVESHIYMEPLWIPEIYAGCAGICCTCPRRFAVWPTASSAYFTV